MLEQVKIQELNFNKQREFIKDYFSGLDFNEEAHRYKVGNTVIKKSVSTMAKDFVEPVDFYNIAQNIDKKLKLPKGTTKRMWKLKGDEANAKGTRAHYFAEIYANYRSIRPTSKLEQAAKYFIDNLPDYIKIAFTELKMYHKKYMFAGTADLIFYNTRTGKYIIGDFKTNEDLFKTFGDKRMLKPFENFMDNNMSKYIIQLNYYQLLLEQTGVEVEGRVLIWLKPTGMYQTYKLVNVTNKLKTYLKQKYES